MLGLRARLFAPFRRPFVSPAALVSWRGLQTEQSAPLTPTPLPSSPAGVAQNTAKNGGLSTETSGFGRRKRKQPTRRPRISTAEPRKWNRPVAKGFIPAYDLALNYLQADSLKLKLEARELGKIIAGKEAEYQTLSRRVDAEPTNEKITEEKNVKDIELESLREKELILEVQSEINLPQVRWEIANAMVDMSKSVHRHFMEQRWRKEGELDLLMERIHQMNVVPDVVPVLHPSLDLQITVKSTPEQLQQTKKRDTRVVPGAYLTVEQTLEPPKVYANIYHTDTRLYTLFMADLDVPSEERKSYTTYLHWMQPNIPLSATKAGRLLDLNNHTTYIPPHPQRGTPYHRYVLLLLPQPPSSGRVYSLNAAARAKDEEITSMYLDIPLVSERHDFNFRQFIKDWGLNPAKGGGAHMWREVWDDTVSKIYAEMLGSLEPHFGRPRKCDPYTELKDHKRYI